MNFVELLAQLEKIKCIDRAKECLFESTTADSDIEKALCWCISAHEKVRRMTGEPYAVHPILVSTLVAFFGGDATLIKSSLLHDVVEDTDVSLDRIEEEFGVEVRDVVDGVTKIKEIRKKQLVSSDSNEELFQSASTFHNMLIRSIDNVGVLIVKLCDRLHNMMTLHGLPPKKQKRVAEETLYVYAPIAHRLGISVLRNYLENKGFLYAFPAEYKEIEDRVEKHRKSVQKGFDRFISLFNFQLMENGFTDEPFSLSPSIKHLYSIYQKTRRQKIEVVDVIDLFRVRLLVHQPLSCYKALGVIHLNFRPYLERFKDHISFSKDNGYQTLHAMVKFEEMNFEIQIRTFDMHKTAEYGIAAGWKYKKAGLTPKLDWLANTEKTPQRLEQFYRDTQNDLTVKDIVVSTPEGMPLTLPLGSIALDFAYRIHSELGDYGKAAWINGKQTSMFQILKTGDMIHIDVDKSRQQRFRGISQVRTALATRQISLNFRRRQAHIYQFFVLRVLAGYFAMDPDDLASFMKKKKIGFDPTRVALKSAFQLDLIKKVQAEWLKTFKPEKGKRKRRIKVQQLDPYIFRYGKKIKHIETGDCCHPNWGQEIVGVGLGKGVLEIHDVFCPEVYRTLTDIRPMAFVGWKEVSRYSCFMRLEIINDINKTVSDIFQVFSKNDIQVCSFLFPEHKGKVARCEIKIETEISKPGIIKSLFGPNVRILEFALGKKPSVGKGE